MFEFTVGLKGEESESFTEYKVTGFSLNTDIPGASRLALNFLDGSVIIVPEFEKKYFKIYPDKLVADNFVGRMKRGEHPVTAKKAVEKDMQDARTTSELPS